MTFRVHQDSKLIFLWPACEELSSRVASVLGLKSMYQGEGKADHGLQAQAFIASPNHTVRNRRQIWFFAQNRWIQDKSLQAALLDGCRNFLMHGEYPIACVFLTCPLEDIDVNIHPSKSEVKFAYPSEAYRAVLRAAKDCMERSEWLKDVLSSPTKSGEDYVLKARAPSALKSSVAPAWHPPKRKIFDESFPKELEVSPIPQPSTAPVGEGATVPIQEVWSHSDINFSPKFPKWQDLSIVGQAKLTYIITQTENNLLLIDQHAAHERVLFEDIYKAWKEGKPLEAQNLLLPLELDVDKEERVVVEESLKEFEKIGLSVSLEDNRIQVSAIPVVMQESSVLNSLKKFITESLEHGGSQAVETSLTDLFATMACHSAVRAGQSLTLEQMHSLLKKMDEHRESSFCPHGRPVFVEYPFSKLERDFGRIV